MSCLGPIFRPTRVIEVGYEVLGCQMGHLTNVPEHESAAIMTKVAANVEKSTDARRQYVYKQSIISNLVRSNWKTARLHGKGSVITISRLCPVVETNT